MLPAALTRYSAWLLGLWCAFIAGWLVVDIQRQPMCLFGWLRCGPLPPSPGSLWLKPTRPVWIVAVGLVGALVLAGLWWFEGRRTKAEITLVGRAPRVRTVALVGVAGTLVSAHLLLLAPVWDELPCGEPVRINSTLAYPLNCDSGLFLELAHHPGQLLEANSVRQSRPGYVYLGAAATAVLGPVAWAIGLDEAYGSQDSAYVPLVLINLLIAAAALALFCWLMLRLGVSRPIVAMLGAILMINDLTKAYYWSPHQQMFTLLVPIATIAMGRWLLLREPTVRRVALLGLALGLSLLAYGSVVVPIAVAGVLLIIVTLRRPRPRATSSVAAAELVSVGGPRPALGTDPDAGNPTPGPEPRIRRLPRLAGLLAVLGGASAAPNVVWITVCTVVAGSYYNHEAVAYRQFVWLPDALRAGGTALSEALTLTAAQTSQQLIEVAWLLGGLLALLVLAAALVSVRLVPRSVDPIGSDEAAGQRATLVAIAVTIAASVIFLYAIGFWAYRVTYNLVPVLLVAIGWAAATLAARSAAAKWTVYIGLGVTATAWVTFQLLSHGPYS